MVFTRNMYTSMAQHHICIADISGSMSDQGVCDKINDFKNNLPIDDIISIYTSNHRMKQLYHHDNPSHVPDLDFTCGGLSAIYDNVFEIIKHELSFKNKVINNLIIFSDMDDNCSEQCNKRDHEYLIQNISHMWKV